MRKVHFIAIGGSVMHRLAIALKKEGWQVSGSDDAIYGVSKKNLKEEDLLPKTPGWDSSRVTPDLDYIILGMHAKENNPELEKAKDLGLTIMSFPEFIYNQCVNKQRIVIGGSHGKTTITAVLLHILKNANKEFDYVIGASVKDFEDQVKLTDAPVIVIEGDEYLASPIDRTPKFLKFNHHIGVISGVSWDHANVFPTEEDYVKQFDLFADQTPKSGSIIYNEDDSMTQLIGSKEREDVSAIGYTTLPYKNENNDTILIYKEKEIPLKVFGKHNISNISGAIKIAERMGVSLSNIATALSGFEGADRRLEIKFNENDITIISDFAHAPSKVKASVSAVREKYPKRNIIACLELHTFSSLNKKFLANYRNTMKKADSALVLYSPENVKSKNLPKITSEDISNSFNKPDLEVFVDSEVFKNTIKELLLKNTTLLLMSSGTFDSLDISELHSTL